MLWADHMECLHSSLAGARSLTIPQMPSKWHKTNDMPRDEHQLTKPGVAGEGGEKQESSSGSGGHRLMYVYQWRM